MVPDTPADDAALLQAWRDGDATAGDALFARHFSTLFRFFRNKVDDAIAEDLTQTTFLACVDGRDRFRGESSFRTYLFSIARNQLLMHFRRRGRGDKVVESSTESAVDLGAGPVTLALAHAEQRLLLDALRRIPIDSQIAIELYYWEGIGTPDIAEILGVPPATARSRLTRARESLARQIEALADSPQTRASTLGGFETWARSLRSEL